jgi:hypothetical protein
MLSLISQGSSWAQESPGIPLASQGPGLAWPHRVWNQWNPAEAARKGSHYLHHTQSQPLGPLPDPVLRQKGPGPAEIKLFQQWNTNQPPSVLPFARTKFMSL